MKYVKNVGVSNHPLPDGRSIAPEEFGSVDPSKDPASADAIESGALITVSESEYEQYSGKPVEPPPEPSFADLVKEAKETWGIEDAGKGNLRSREAINAAIQEAAQKKENENGGND